MVRVPYGFASPSRKAIRRVTTSIVLTAATLLAANEAALAQNACARCINIGPFSFPNPFAGPAPGPSYAPIERASRGSEPRRKVSSLGRGGRPGGVEAGYSISVCVRTCDGSFFPLPYAGAAGSTLEQVCQALCPNAEMALYSMPFGGTIDEGVSPTGARYSALPNARKFEQSYEPSCSCRRPGQGWADALAAAEARYGHRAHEVVVTEEAAIQMSRPKLAPATTRSPAQKAQLASAAEGDAAKEATALIEGQLATVQIADPDIDANGVDTRLKAATAAVSRETSGIRDDAGDVGARFGLREGTIVEEADPEGGVRRVRVLAPLF